MLDFSCFIACKAMAGNMEYVGQFTDTSHVHIAKYFPVIALGVMLYFLFFHKKSK